VINKPPRMVVHPARGHWSGTLASALQHHFGGGLSTAGGPTRPGIVHRLDRDTSGAILVAKHDLAHGLLGAQFQSRAIRKEYFALVAGRARPRPRPDRPADRRPPAAAREDGHPPRRRPGAARPRPSTKSSSGSTATRPFGCGPRPAARTRSASTWQSRRLPGALRPPLRRPIPDHPRRDPPPRRTTRSGALRPPGPPRLASGLCSSGDPEAAGSGSAAAGGHRGRAAGATELSPIRWIGRQPQVAKTSRQVARTFDRSREHSTGRQNISTCRETVSARNRSSRPGGTPEAHTHRPRFRRPYGTRAPFLAYRCPSDKSLVHSVSGSQVFSAVLSLRKAFCRKHLLRVTRCSGFPGVPNVSLGAC
jgi:hypothetical protein